MSSPYGLPGSVNAVIGRNTGPRPQAMTSLSGLGLPSSRITNGAPHQPSVGLMPDGMSGFKQRSAVGSSSVDPVSDPVRSIHDQHMIDLEQTKLEDFGDMELTFMDVLSGPAGSSGQNAPHRFASLSRLNQIFKEQLLRDQTGVQRNPHWFNDQWSFAGTIRHEDTKGRYHAEDGDLCQLFTGAQTTLIYDIFQCYDHGSKGVVGAAIGDLLWLVLRRFEWQDEQDRVLGPVNGKAKKKEHYWQLCPVYTRSNEEVPLWCHTSVGPNGSQGLSILVGRVAKIYNVPSNISAARASARDIVYNADRGAAYKSQLTGLRQLEILQTIV